MAVNTITLPTIRDPDDLYQRDTRQALEQLANQSVQKSTVLVGLGTTTTLVNHQLGKKPQAWTIIDKNAQADVWRDTTQPITNDKIPLKASAAVTVALQFW